jgi:hypothetical protein
LTHGVLLYKGKGNTSPRGSDIPRGLKDFENKPRPKERFSKEGQAIAVASAMTWERTTIRTMSFRSVTTFNRASFMTVSSKKNGETTPLGREISPGGERTTV